MTTTRVPDPTASLNQVSDSAMRAPGSGVAESDWRRKSANDGPASMALSVATVIQVDYERHLVTLRTESGETFERAPTPMSYPAAGARHFLGALPIPGDVALVGWGNAESGGGSTVPYVLGWFPGGVMGGHDWWVTQPFSQEEFGFSGAQQATFEGVANRTRHKLRHMLPGNIVASSAQGADLVLDEGVLLANRRGNEVRLRDQDQAFIVRSLQQFHAGAGFRVYSGLVQRDARRLPTSMFSDGVDWAAAAQLDDQGLPLDEGGLGASDIAAGRLTPNKVFQRGADGQRTAVFPAGADGITRPPFGGNVDPYIFLQKGLLVDSLGRSTADTPDAVYGGKALYRVSAGGTNAAVDTAADALTEFRIEVSHLADGTLPVTEQTDGFDADRLPSTVPRLPGELNGSINAPFIEMVMGTVVGNDPYSLPGKALYGRPIRPVVFVPGVPTAAPALADGLTSPLAEHAAFLLRVTPPIGASPRPTFWSVTKDGRVRASVMGPGTGFSAEVALGAGLRLDAGATPDGESFIVTAGGKVALRSSRGDNLTNTGVEITSDQGAVVIRGDGANTTGDLVAPTGAGAVPAPGVLVSSARSILVQAGDSIVLSAARLNLQDVSNLLLSAEASLDLRSGDAIKQTSNSRDTTVLGKATETYSGPKNGLPTNGAAREVTIATNPATGFVGGTADAYALIYGDRVETLAVGNHSTAVAVGNQTYTVGVGAFTASSGPNSMAATAGGVAVTAATGVATFSALAGATTISGSLAASVTSLGPTLVRGAVITLTAPGIKVGGIVSGSDLDPLTGLPLVLLGLGSPTHLLAVG